MKKIVIYMSRLKHGGMEKSLIDFLNMSNISEKNDVCLYLGYTMDKNLIELIPKNIKIKLLAKKWNVLGKIIAEIKLTLLKIKYTIVKDAYDVSICYTNHQKIFSDLARLSSKNSILFVHSDVSRYSSSEMEKMKKKIKYDKFKTIICNSNKSKNALQSKYEKKLNIKVIPNYIDGENIIKKSNEKVTEDVFDKRTITFINIANHVEEFKNISLIINTSAKLKNDYNFKVLLIGSGKDTDYYKELIKEFKLEDYIFILGTKSNPYPYLKNSDCLLFTSKYEGYGLVLNEARVLGVPIITSNCGASEEIVTKEYGNIFYKDSELGKLMADFINKPNKKKTTFDYKEFNKIITNEFKNIIGKE